MLEHLLEQLSFGVQRLILLHGVAGVGKTYLLRGLHECLSSRESSRCVALDGTAFVSARNTVPCALFGGVHGSVSDALSALDCGGVLLIDDADVFCAHPPHTTQAGLLLEWLAGLAPRGIKVCVVMAVQALTAVHPAFTRTGLFDCTEAVPLPRSKQRYDILRTLLSTISVDPFVHELCRAALAESGRAPSSLNTCDSPIELWLCKRTTGFSPRDLLKLCRAAQLAALARSTQEPRVAVPVLFDDFAAALDQVRPAADANVQMHLSGPASGPGDIVGYEKLRQDVLFLLECGVRPERCEHFGVAPPCGLLLHGPSGCGKTALVRVLTRQLHAHIVAVKGPALMSKYVGSTEKHLRALFARARQRAPTVLFFDELDSLCPARDGCDDSASSGRVVSQLLNELDGISARDGVLVIGSTNRLAAVDPALIRPGRFDRVLEVGYPSAEDRAALLRHYTRCLTLGPDVELAAWAERLAGRSCAAVRALCRDACLCALRESDSAAATLESSTPTHTTCVVSQKHFENALNMHAQ